MKNVVRWMAFLSSAFMCFAQQNSFENRLRLDTIHANQMEGWEFDATSISCLRDGLWEHLLPKSSVGTNKIILNKNELNYFLELDDIKIITESEPIANPEHWEDRFGRQIQTLTLSKPLTFLAIKDGKLVQFSVDTLIGLQYATFYPYGELDVTDKDRVPIVYQQDNQFDEYSPVLLISSTFLDYIDIYEVKIYWYSIHSGSEGGVNTRYIIGLDFNGDFQDEVIMYHETTQDSWASEGDEGESHTRSIIALYYKNKWHRTSYWQDGQDGIEGF